MDIDIPKNYSPSEDEEFMNPLQRAYFRRKLVLWKEKIMGSIQQTMEHLKDEPATGPDIIDVASIEEEHNIEIYTEERALKLIEKIDRAIERIDKKQYGYCMATGKPIALSRLKARPIATLCIEAQEQHEREKRMAKRP
ncbi:MAG: RNA polymerase-binding protein DksA [Alphaproteobacteria bacterium GM7ARS4]|nr:RNA polymerase-binding protein DksA [Alphaproteobacteria bacterium GM7ARS4]